MPSVCQILSYVLRPVASNGLSLAFDDSGPMQWLCSSERCCQSQLRNPHPLEITPNHQKKAFLFD